VRDAPKVRYARNGEALLAYQVVGEGPLDLVCILGHYAQLDLLWDDPAHAHFLGRLASFSRLILYDGRGTGLSGRTTGPYSFEDGAGDLRAVLDAVGSTSTAHFSCCVNGRLSMVTAASHPEKVTALVLFGSHPATMRDADYPYGARSEDTERLAQEFLESWGDDEYQASRLHHMAPSTAGDPRIARWFARMCRAYASPPEMAQRLRMIKAVDVRFVLPTISVPTLILHRTGDGDADIGASRYMAERIPTARLVELPGADHLPAYGDADGVLDEVETFLTGVRPLHPPERILATVMFTDIVESTRQAAALGDRRWRALLEGHRAMVREELRRSGGTEVQTTGDGFLATFEPDPGHPLRTGSGRGRGVARPAIAGGDPHRRVRTGRRRRGWDRRPHRRSHRLGGGGRRGSGLPHGAGPRGGLGRLLRRSGIAPVERCRRFVAAVRGAACRHDREHLTAAESPC
jgi:pimeloyl-ACP methyl ester carboxylesterase